jgi:hypothetical protein
MTVEHSREHNGQIGVCRNGSVPRQTFAAVGVCGVQEKAAFEVLNNKKSWIEFHKQYVKG